MNTLKSSILVCAPRVLARFPVLFAYLYGSQATGAVHPFSDTDIAVFLREDVLADKMPLESEIALAFDDAIDHSAETDVRAINEMPLMLQGEILTEGLLLYSIDDQTRISFETRIRMAYFDFRPTINSYYRNYAADELNAE